MFAYYCELALRSLRRNVVLTALMIAAVGVGIGASMTVLTVLRSLSADPIPGKSSVLFTPQIDVWGPDSRRPDQGASGDRLPSGLTYRDAIALLQAHRAPKQAAMYGVSLVITPRSGKPFRTNGRATSTDFFPMFDVPFASGGPWSASEDARRGNVVVLGSKLAERLFAHTDAVGKTIDLGGRDFRVVGVASPWLLQPRFYDVNSGAFGQEEDFFLPFSTAIDRHINTDGYENCTQPPTAGWDAHLNSSCVWVQFWAELPTAAQVRDYRSFLYAYASEQRQLGRFHWPPRIELRDVTDWMVYNHVVPPALRAIGIAADGFLVVCLINALGLMLAKFASRSRELGLRQALGASRRDIFMQCVAEATTVGLLGGVLGLALTGAGLAGLRALFGLSDPTNAAHRLVTLNAGMVFITIGVAVIATICAGLYPTYRASRVQPALQLKVQ